jgi:hypothetical protein
MSDTQAQASPKTTAEQAALVRTALAEVERGKATLADVVKAVLGTPAAAPEPAVEPAPPVPLSLSDKEKAALARLPEVYGKVMPTKARALTHPEAAAIVEEREVIDTLLKILKSRKDDSIREIIAFHLDSVAADEARTGAERDDKGHLLLKQEVVVDGTSRKFQRILNEGAPVMPSAADLLAEYEAGRLTRMEYLALTSVPEVPRVFDPDKARVAFKKDPGLLFRVARLAKPGKKTSTIKVAPA